MPWRQLSPQEAGQHPLYGVRGWLLFFMILVVIAMAVRIYGLLVGPAMDTPGDVQVEVNATFVTAFNAIAIVLYAFVLFMAFSYHPAFPTVAIAALWIGVALDVVGMLFFPTEITVTGGRPEARQVLQQQIDQTATASLTIGLIVNVVIALLLTWYFLSSKRVNVTYRHRVPAEG